MRVHLVLKALIFTMAIGILAVSSAKADELYGRIRGTVTDPSGAVIVGAQVRATDVGTGVTKQTASGADGSYEFLQLAAPATYRVSVSQSGFKAFEAKNIHLDLNQVFVLNIKLQLGEVAQVISVEAPIAQINTTSMQLGQTVTGKQVVDLPLNGRDFIQLQQLQPGVVAQGDARLTDAYATNGGEAQQNAFYVNGMDIGDIALNVPDIVIPSPDAIGEFHLVTNTLNPEYGRNSGAVMNIIIKNGTNQHPR